MIKEAAEEKYDGFMRIVVDGTWKVSTGENLSLSTLRSRSVWKVSIIWSSVYRQRFYIYPQYNIKLAFVFAC